MHSCSLLILALLPFTLALPTHKVKSSTLANYLRDVAPLFANDEPEGTYKGTSSVIGENINLELDFDRVAKTVNITFTGVLALNCNNESYSYSAQDGAISLTDFGKDSDCLTQALKENLVTLQSINYVAGSDTINIKAKYTVLDVPFTLQHVSRHAMRRLPQKTLVELFDEKFSSYALKDPSGTYSADQNIFGLEITSTIVIGSDEFNFEITSPISVSCTNEAFTINGDELVITNLNQPGDCMGDLSQQWDVTVTKLTYDSVSDTLTAKVAFAGLPISLTFKHSQGVVVKAKPVFSTKQDMLAAIQARTHAALTNPAGEYKGSKSVLGQTVDTVLIINSDGTLNFQVSGVVSINCNEEPFTFANNDIDITNINNNGDCVHDALSTNHVTLSEIAFNSASNEVTVTLKYSVVSIVLPLEHVTRLTPVQIEQRYAALAFADPGGKYFGKTSFLTIDLEVTAVINTNTVDLTFTINTDTDTCPGEAYSYDSSSHQITVPGASTPGDCIYNALNTSGASVIGIEYIPSTDQVYFDLQVSFFQISVEMNKV